MADWLNDERELLARTLTAEAGNQGIPGLLAAGSVIMNRVNQGGYGDGVRGVILKPGQFSPLNSITGYAGGEQGQDMAAIRPTSEAYSVADALLSGNYSDPTGGATHFYNPDISSPSWGGGEGWKRIGAHVFGKADAGRGGNMAPQQRQSSPVVSTSGQMPQQDERQPFFKNPDFWDRLAIGLGGMTLNPNVALLNASAGRIEQRAADRGTAKQRNATAEWLRSQGRDDLADAVQSGAIGGRDALGLMQPQKQDQTAAMQNYQFLLAQGVDPKEAQKQAFGGGTTVNVGGGEATPFQEAVDKKFADRYLDWKTSGAADASQQVAQISSVLSKLEQGQPLTGPMVGAIQSVGLGSILTPDAQDAKDRVESVVQRSLRETLGAQFTAAEGDRLIARSYNPSLRPEQNAARLRALYATLSAADKAKRAMIEYVEANGTLAGYSGPRIPSADEIEAEMDKAAPFSGQSGGTSGRIKYDADGNRIND